MATIDSATIDSARIDSATNRLGDGTFGGDELTD
jgi:hypothetical protein